MNVLSGNFPNVNDVYKYKIYFSTLADEYYYYYKVYALIK